MKFILNMDFHLGLTCPLKLWSMDAIICWASSYGERFPNLIEDGFQWWWTFNSIHHIIIAVACDINNNNKKYENYTFLSFEYLDIYGMPCTHSIKETDIGKGKPYFIYFNKSILETSSEFVYPLLFECIGISKEFYAHIWSRKLILEYKSYTSYQPPRIPPTLSFFCSYVTLRVPPLYLGNQVWYHRSAGVKTTGKNSE